MEELHKKSVLRKDATIFRRPNSRVLLGISKLHHLHTHGTVASVSETVVAALVVTVIAPTI
jgi:hypothetical protein